MKRGTSFYIFAILFHVWLKRDNYILICFSFDLLCYVVLIEVYEEGLLSFRCVVGKERNIFNCLFR